MPTEIVTTDDLREFKIELVKEIKQLLAVHHQAAGDFPGNAPKPTHQRHFALRQNRRGDVLRLRGNQKDA